MEEYYDDVEMAINNNFDYSNIVPTVSNIAVLIKYCEQVYNKLEELINEDEEKNKMIKYDLQTYNYKRNYNDYFEVTIRDKNFASYTCKKYDAFMELVNSGQVNNLSSLGIRLGLGYKCGETSNFIDHQNDLEIKFKPYEITFTRKSNFKEYTIDQTEKNINKLLQEFPAVDTIFCSKN